MAESRKERNSSIELMKILALFLVVLCHSLPLYKLGGATELAGYIDLRHSVPGLNGFMLLLFSHLGQVGNALFIVSSAYFLADSNCVRKGKIAQFILDTWVVSVVYLVLFMIVRGHIPLTYMITSLFPVTFNFYWFITCYILLYAIHPWLNLIIRTLDKKQLFTANICLLTLYCGVSFVLNGKYYYTQLVGFIVYYFLVAYVKLYLPRFCKSRVANTRLLAVSLCVFVGLILAVNFAGLRFSALSGGVGILETFINPFILGIAVAAFNLCNLRCWRSRAINRVSSTSMLVFVIINNQLVCSFAKPFLFERVYNQLAYRHIPLVCLGIALAALAASVLLALLLYGDCSKACYQARGMDRREARRDLRKVV